VPAAVVDDARAYLAKLERELEELRAAGPQAQLPLVAPRPAAPATDALTDRLAAIDVDALSPRDALALVYELAELARREGS
jgi:DNA mismatch repair protein MutS